jgi:hypothetical protein
MKTRNLLRLNRDPRQPGAAPQSRVTKVWPNCAKGSFFCLLPTPHRLVRRHLRGSLLRLAKHDRSCSDRHAPLHGAFRGLCALAGPFLQSLACWTRTFLNDKTMYLSAKGARCRCLAKARKVPISPDACYCVADLFHNPLGGRTVIARCAL